MPKSKNKCVPSRETAYAFYTCPCGWECIIDNIKDVKRAEKLRGMKVRGHNKNCNEGKRTRDLGDYTLQMNGSHVCGRDAKAQDAADRAGKVDGLKHLMSSQFPDVTIKI
jgi:hypothetical protein